AGLWLAQTPQVFRREWLLAAYADRARLGPDVTDDAQLVEAAGHKVHVVEGSPSNIKITAPPDLALAKALLQSRPAPDPPGPAPPCAEEGVWRGAPPAGRPCCSPGPCCCSPARPGPSRCGCPAAARSRKSISSATWWPCSAGTAVAPAPATAP